MTERCWPLLLLLLVGCGSPTGDSVSVTGSSTLAPLVAEIARRYEGQHPGVRIDVQTGGSSRGIADARAGVAQLGMISRELAPEEATELRAFPIARDGIALIVHRDNPVAELSQAQVVALYRGAKQRWPDGTQVTVVHKADGRATQQVFLQHFQLAIADVDPDVVIGDNEQGIKTVAGNRGAIGYVSIGAAQVAAARGVAIRLLPVAGVEATLENLRAGRYPIARTLHLVARGEPGGAVGDFVAFARSPAVHDLVERLHLAPIAR